MNIRNISVQLCSMVCLFIFLFYPANGICQAKETSIAMDYYSGGVLFGVWGSSGKDVYAVGDGGTILHYDGISWKLIMGGDYGKKRKSGITGKKQLAYIWGTSKNDVFVAGVCNGPKSQIANYYFHYNGTQWSRMSNGKAVIELKKRMMRDFHFCFPDITKVWGFDKNHYYGVEGSKLIMQTRKGRDEIDTGLNSDRLLDIWGTSMTDIYLGSNNGKILHFNGINFDKEQKDCISGVNCIWGSSPSDIYAVGFDGSTILHFDGRDWTKIRTGLYEDESLLSIWGASKDDIFAVGVYYLILHYDGKKWKRMKRW